MFWKGKFGAKPRKPPEILFKQQIYKEKRQTAYKPGSVPPLQAAMTIPLGRLLPGVSRDRPGRRPGNRLLACASVPPLFGLAPGGVCHATPVTGSAVRSYRTLSPLPAGRNLLAVCSLLHFPWGCPRRALPGTLASVEPGLSSTQETSPWTAAIQPSGRA